MDRRGEPVPPDYYARLGVRPSASAETIQEAYRKKAQETHPDHNPNDPDAAERFQKIQEAYRVLRDPERREAYDAARTRVPDVLIINQQAPVGCGGYLWRVFAGMTAVAVFFVLEALGVWAAGTWTILLAVGGAALVAGLIAAAVANRFPDRATDVVLRLDPRRMTMRADGRAVLQVPWTAVQAVRIGDRGETLELEVHSQMVEDVAPVPPVLTAVRPDENRAFLRFDLSDTDARHKVLVNFLRSTNAVPLLETSSPRPGRN